MPKKKTVIEVPEEEMSADDVAFREMVSDIEKEKPILAKNTRLVTETSVGFPWKKIIGLVNYSNDKMGDRKPVPKKTMDKLRELIGPDSWMEKDGSCYYRKEPGCVEVLRAAGIECVHVYDDDNDHRLVGGL